MSDPNRLVITRGGGVLSIFGLPFLAAGLAIICLGVLNLGEEGLPVLFAVPFGAVFAGIGAAFAFGRAGLVLDRAAGTATHWWGLLVPFSSTTVPLVSIRGVLIHREERRSKDSSYTVYPVRLDSSKDRILVREFQDYMAARRCAEEAAKFLNLGIRDVSTGTAVEREAGTLDESLRDQARRTGRVAETPPPPEGCRVSYDVSGDEVTFDLPKIGFRGGHWAVLTLALLGSLLLAAFLLPMFLSGKSNGSLLALVSAPIAVIVTGVVLSANTRERVRASPERLRVERYSALHQSPQEIPADRLEELFLTGDLSLGGRMANPTGRVICARSDDLSMRFGDGLTDTEVTWLKAMVEALVTAAPQGKAGRTDLPPGS